MNNKRATYYPFVEKSSLFEKVKGIIVALGVILTVCSFIGETPFLVVPSFILLYFMFSWFAVDNYPPAILIALLYQWMQVSVKVLYATLTFTSLESLTDFPEHIVDAYLLSCLGLLAMSFGIKSMLKKINISFNTINTYIKTINTKKALLGYLLFSFGATISFQLRFAIPGLFQGIVALGYIKWSLFFIVFYISFKQKKDLGLLKLVIAYEFLMGFVSYFASFKTIIFMGLISYLSIGTFKKKQIPLFLLLFVGLFYIALAWTAVKMDYREYLNQGSNQQVINVEGGDAFNYIINSLTTVSGEKLEDAGVDLLDRISYIDYFSSCMAYVPDQRPFEDGLLTKNTIMHVLVPRIINPDKPAIDDSQHLTKYTGIFYADGAMGVSFALGYVADFYVDYGPFLMILALFIFGKGIGYILFSIHKTSLNSIWAMAIMVPVFILLYKFENSLIKFVGNLIMFWMVAFLFNKYVAKRIETFIKM